MRDKDFYTSTEVVKQQSELSSFKYRNERIIGYLSDYIDKYSEKNILDIGERSPLTERIKEVFRFRLDNTHGDLDTKIDHSISGWYDLIIFSHVIEHLFNPLLALECIKNAMAFDGLLIICAPIKPHYLPWGKGHFHELDEYRFKKLIDRAGLKIVRWERFRNGPLLADLGIRPILRKLFWKEQSFVVCKLYK